MVVAWSATRANRDLAAANEVLMQGRSYPYPLTSLRLETPATRVVESWQPDTGATNEKYLVLFSSGTCPTCVLNGPNWEELLRALRPTDRVAVWMIDYGAPSRDTPLVKGLAARGIPYKVLQVTNQTLFSLETGLDALPTTMLVDSTMHPLLTRPGMLDGRTLTLFGRGLRGDLPSGGDPFLPAGQGQGVLVQSAASRPKSKAESKPQTLPKRTDRAGGGPALYSLPPATKAHATPVHPAKGGGTGAPSTRAAPNILKSEVLK